MKKGYSYTIDVFVAVACDLGNEKHLADVHQLLRQYGFKRVHRGVYESVSIKPGILSRLKRDIDRKTDFYDSVRMYQYPVEGTLVITSLVEKKWRKSVLKI